VHRAVDDQLDTNRSGKMNFDRGFRSNAIHHEPIVDIRMHKSEARMTDQMRDVRPPPHTEIVNGDHTIAPLEEGFR
jgi:hypothetical protein